MRARSGRRGSNAIEFAMLFPLFLAIASVIMEYGLYFYAHTNMISAVRGGCRQGSVVGMAESPGPADTAVAGMTGNMGVFEAFNVDCTDPGDPRCMVTAEISGASPEAELTCTAEVAWTGVTGVVPVPGTVRVSMVQVLEIQQ
jgi:hypothetical protein